MLRALTLSLLMLSVASEPYMKWSVCANDGCTGCTPPVTIPVGQRVPVVGEETYLVTTCVKGGDVVLIDHYNDSSSYKEGECNSGMLFECDAASPPTARTELQSTQKAVGFRCTGCDCEEAVEASVGECVPTLENTSGVLVSCEKGGRVEMLGYSNANCTGASVTMLMTDGVCDALTDLKVACVGGEEESGGQDAFVLAGSLTLLFILLASMAASVDTQLFKGHFAKPKPIILGMFCQFVCLPLLGYLAVSIMEVNSVTSVALLTTAMAPGGAFSNWFCSLFNADLALSVAMTTTSTIVALAVLPGNMYLYVETLYGSEVRLNWRDIVISVVSAAAGMVTGLLIGAFRPHWRKKCNIAGTFAGAALLVYGAFTSTTKAPLWDREPLFYLQVAFPCLFGVFVSQVATFLAGLDAPKSVAITIECSYQNTGIAISMVLATFRGDDQGVALGVPLYYGTIQAIILVTFSIVMWKMGRTYASPDVPFLKMIGGNYQPEVVLPTEQCDDVAMDDFDDIEDDNQFVNQAASDTVGNPSSHIQEPDREVPLLVE